ncbi:MAG: hypothetical protein ACK42G_04225, partial [Candidatus Kapaibacteriota bacterium]
LGLVEFRKFYSGYLKNLPNASKVRSKVVVSESYNEIEEILMNYCKQLEEGAVSEIKQEFEIEEPTTF